MAWLSREDTVHIHEEIRCMSKCGLRMLVRHARGEIRTPMYHARPYRQEHIYYTVCYLQYYSGYTNMVFKTCLDSPVVSSVV